MKVISTNENNDIFLDTSGNMSLSLDLDAVVQACESAVKAQMGEMIYQTDQGLPTFDLLWNGNPNIIQAEAAIRTIILNVENVIEITEFTSVVQDNKFRYNATIRTIYGGGLINGL